MFQNDMIPQEIIKNLYLGSIFSFSPTVLRNLGINNVVSAINSNSENTWNHLNLKWDDLTSQKIFPSIDYAYYFIDSKLNKGEKVLVHCHAGISRSATVVIYYLMKKFGLSYNDAYSIVKLKRNIINPNPGFIHQLKYYENAFE